MSRVLAFRFILLSGPVAVVAACGAETATTPVGAGGGAPSDAAPADGASADTSADALLTPDAAADAPLEASDSGSCIVSPGCTNPGTLEVPVERSGNLAPACAAGPGATLAERCTAFCRAANPGFGAQTTCSVAPNEATFQCRCVNP
jgi:hypothetical protein